MCTSLKIWHDIVCYPLKFNLFSFDCCPPPLPIFQIVTYTLFLEEIVIYTLFLEEIVTYTQSVSC